VFENTVRKKTQIRHEASYKQLGGKDGSVTVWENALRMHKIDEWRIWECDEPWVTYNVEHGKK
jgi:hypothetical protein